jgi:hypothetical protein
MSRMCDRPDQLMCMAAQWAKLDGWSRADWDDCVAEAWEEQPDTPEPVQPGGVGGPKDLIGKLVSFGENNEKQGTVLNVSEHNTAEVDIEEIQRWAGTKPAVFTAHWLTCRPIP